MSDNVDFPELYKFLSEASDDTLKLIGVSPSDDEFSRGPSSTAGDDNKQPDLDPHALQASNSEPNFDDKAKRPVRELSMPQVSTPATPMESETMHRYICEEMYTNLLRQRADTKATVLSAGDLRMLFELLGMSPEVTKDEIRRMLKKTRYADESGLMDIEYFSIFAKDFELLETCAQTIHERKISQLEGGVFKFMLHDLFKELADSHRGPAKDQQECDTLFKQLLNQRRDPTAIVLPAGHLCGMLKKLGMPTKVNEDELGAILTFLGYADGNGTLDYEQFMYFNWDFKLLESLHAYELTSRKRQYVERGPLRKFFKKLDYVVLEPPRFPGSSSNEGSNRMQPLFEQPVLPISASASPNYRDRMHHRKCKRWFDRLLSFHGDPNATALRAGSRVCGILKKLGMAQEVTDDQLRDMLKYSGHADEDGTLDFERFTIFAKDFLLVESLRTRKASRQNDQGPLGDFFEFLSSCVDDGEEFSDFNFSDAFDCMGIELKGGTADVLARYYAIFQPGIEITFEQFLRVLRKYYEERMQRAGQAMTSRRPVVLDKRCRLGRLLAFVSTYTRGDGAEREGFPVVRNNDTEMEGDVTNIPAVTPVFCIPK